MCMVAVFSVNVVMRTLCFSSLLKEPLLTPVFVTTTEFSTWPMSLQLLFQSRAYAAAPASQALLSSMGLRRQVQLRSETISPSGYWARLLMSNSAATCPSDCDSVELGDLIPQAIATRYWPDEMLLCYRKYSYAGVHRSLSNPRWHWRWSMCLTFKVRETIVHDLHW